MSIRVLCLVLMVVVQPYGWYTWIFGLGAAVLPYIAVVLANVGKDAHEAQAERPDLALPAQPAADARDEPGVIRIPETHRLRQHPDERASDAGTGHRDGDAP